MSIEITSQFRYEAVCLPSLYYTDEFTLSLSATLKHMLHQRKKENTICNVLIFLLVILQQSTKCQYFLSSCKVYRSSWTNIQQMIIYDFLKYCKWDSFLLHFYTYTLPLYTGVQIKTFHPDTSCHWNTWDCSNLKGKVILFLWTCCVCCYCIWDSMINVSQHNPKLM